MDPASAARAVRFPQLAKYELIEELGHGGMATVYRARDKRLDREVAVKVIHPHLRDSREVVSRFETEARAVAKLRHANIVEVYDVSEATDSEQYLVVELLRGTTLRKLLQGGKALPPEVAAAIGLDLLAALNHAHGNGVIHRDIKPENVLIEHRGGGSSPSGMVVKLTDFGIAKLLDAQGVTSTGQVLGSPAHMAPEQIEGGEVGARSDVFGLGVLLYECMVGHLPFEGANPAQVLRRVLDGHYPDPQKERAVVGARWSAVLDRALSHAPEDRFVDAEEMRRAVLAELERLGVPDAARELEEWFLQPEAYEQSRAPRMIEKLVALGAEARKRGDVLAAAADYNRALAHAPHDPQLLRIVAAMGRAEVRARRLRRGAAGLGVLAGVGVVAYGIASFSRRPVPLVPPSPAPSAATALVPPPSVDVRVAPPQESASASAAVTPSAARAIVPAVPRETAPRVVERNFVLNLQPAMGLKLSVDGEPAREVSTGWKQPLDGRGHLLTFSCDVCVEKQVAVPPGDRDDTLAVKVPIKPATLNVQGDVKMTYRIEEDPQLVIRAGSNPVPLVSQFRSLTVRQLETNARVRVRVEAGKTSEVLF